jgi:hypothetical protein
MTNSAAPSVLFVYRAIGGNANVALTISEARELDPNSDGEFMLFGAKFEYIGAR